MFAEFAIALPLLILLGWGLATVGTKIFYLGKIQLADYVMEEEVHNVLSRLIYDARAAKKIIAVKGSPTLIFYYRTMREIQATNSSMPTNIYGTPDGDVIADREEPRVYWRVNDKIYYQRQTKEARNPITGDNYFGRTKVTRFDFDFDKKTKILNVTLEMESLDSPHKIKIDTAVYVSGYEG